MFQGWENFFVLIGTAGAGLIGLLFVVVTLTAGGDRARALRGAKLYMTPTAGYFGAALLIALAALTPALAPLWSGVALVALAGFGLFGAGRAIVGIGGIKGEPAAAHWTDLWFYGVVPAGLYAALAVDGFALAAEARWAVTATAATAVTLLLLGLHNAWDLITWIAPARAGAGADAASG